MAQWDSTQYLAFADERTRAARELLARVPLGDAQHVVDLGCGPGNSTALLLRRWPSARVVGVDSSEDMLARARTDLPDVEWLEADAGSFTPQTPLDVLFANALLQWLPHHDVLLPRLLGFLRSGGVLAIQMPHNFEEPSHTLIRELGKWTSRLAGVRARSPVSPAAYYYDLLAPLAQQVDIWQTTYEHVMPSAKAIVDWVKGTGLRPFLAALPERDRTAYLEEYTRAIEEAYPPRADGKRLFSFPRLFIVAVR